MTASPVYLTRLWHTRTIYVCPQCGTSRSTVELMERHLRALGHTAPPDEAPALQAAPVPAAVDAPAPEPGEA